MSQQAHCMTRFLSTMVALHVVTLLTLGLTGCTPAESGGGTDQQSAQPETEMIVEGRGATILIKPTADDVVSGIITIAITDAPEGVEMAFFAMDRQGESGTLGEGPNIGIDQDGSDGWSVPLDTTRFENGAYEVSGLAMVDADSDPIGGATALLVFEN